MTLLREGRHHLSSEVIWEVANETKTNLIVVGTHGYTGLRKVLLGSIASEVAHEAKQPVLLVQNPKLQRTKTQASTPPKKA